MKTLPVPPATVTPDNAPFFAALQDGRLEQKGLQVVGLTRKDLLDQVVDDVAMAAREGLDEARDIRAALQRERGQLQSGNPALRAGRERADLLCRKRQPHPLGEEGRCFLGAEAQVARAKLGQVASCA